MQSPHLHHWSYRSGIENRFTNSGIKNHKSVYFIILFFLFLGAIKNLKKIIWGLLSREKQLLITRELAKASVVQLPIRINVTRRQAQKLALYFLSSVEKKVKRFEAELTAFGVKRKRLSKSDASELSKQPMKNCQCSVLWIWQQLDILINNAWNQLVKNLLMPNDREAPGDDVIGASTLKSGFQQRKSCFTRTGRMMKRKLESIINYHTSVVGIKGNALDRAILNAPLQKAWNYWALLKKFMAFGLGFRKSAHCMLPQDFIGNLGNRLPVLRWENSPRLAEMDSPNMRGGQPEEVPTPAYFPWLRYE